MSGLRRLTVLGSDAVTGGNGVFYSHGGAGCVRTSMLEGICGSREDGRWIEVP